MSERIKVVMQLFQITGFACDARQRTVPHRLKLIHEVMEMLRTTYGCFDLAPEFFKIDHFTVLELKFSDSTYITNQPSYSHMTVVPVIGAKLQIGAGLHGRLFYRITPTRLYKQPDVQTITGFLSDDFDLLDEHYLELASEPIEKFIEIARSWLINNDYIFEV